MIYFLASGDKIEHDARYTVKCNALLISSLSSNRAGKLNSPQFCNIWASTVLRDTLLRSVWHYGSVQERRLDIVIKVEQSNFSQLKESWYQQQPWAHSALCSEYFSDEKNHIFGWIDEDDVIGIQRPYL